MPQLRPAPRRGARWFFIPRRGRGPWPVTFLDPKFSLCLQPFAGFRVRTLATRMFTWSREGVHVFPSWRSTAMQTQCNTFWKFRLPLQPPNATARSAAPVPWQCYTMRRNATHFAIFRALAADAPPRHNSPESAPPMLLNRIRHRQHPVTSTRHGRSRVLHKY